MAATVRFVKPEHEEVIREYIKPSETGIILVMPKAINEFKKKNIIDDQVIEYDFGGDSDYAVDVVEDETHYAISELSEGD